MICKNERGAFDNKTNRTDGNPVWRNILFGCSIFSGSYIRLHFNQHRFVRCEGEPFYQPLLKPDVKRLIQLLPHDVWLSPDLHYKNDQTISLIKSLYNIPTTTFMILIVFFNFIARLFFIFLLINTIRLYWLKRSSYKHY